MAEEYNTPWKIEGEFVVTGNGKYHKTEIEKIVDQRDHEVNNLRMVNQLIQSGIVVNEEFAPQVNQITRAKNEFLKKYLLVD